MFTFGMDTQVTVEEIAHLSASGEAGRVGSSRVTGTGKRSKIKLLMAIFELKSSHCLCIIDY